jgi:hypothetical protein
MKLNNISKAISVLAIGLAFAACTKTADYVPAEPEENKTYVGANINAPRDVEADGAPIVIPFTRNKVADEMDVTVFLNDASGIFKLDNANLHFAVGQATAFTTVTYSYDDLVPETIYNIAVELASTEYASEYRPIAFPVSAKKAWKNLGMAEVYDDWWLEDFVERKLLKAPDGTETYRLMNPWDKATAEGAGFTYTGGLDYIEFTIADDGQVSWGGNKIINLPFQFSGRTTHMYHPSQRSDAASVAKNRLVAPGYVVICYYPILNYNNGSFSWWGVTTDLEITWDAE